MSNRDRAARVSDGLSLLFDRRLAEDEVCDAIRDARGRDDRSGHRGTKELDAEVDGRGAGRARGGGAGKRAVRDGRDRPTVDGALVGRAVGAKVELALDDGDVSTMPQQLRAEVFPHPGGRGEVHGTRVGAPATVAGGGR